MSRAPADPNGNVWPAFHRAAIRLLACIACVSPGPGSSEAIFLIGAWMSVRMVARLLPCCRFHHRCKSSTFGVVGSPIKLHCGPPSVSPIAKRLSIPLSNRSLSVNMARPVLCTSLRLSLVALPISHQRGRPRAPPVPPEKSYSPTIPNTLGLSPASFQSLMRRPQPLWPGCASTG